MTDDNIVDFKSNKIMADVLKLELEFRQRRNQAQDEIIARMEELSTEGEDELYILWLAINARLIEKHDLTPGDLIGDIRDHFGDDDDGESA